MSLRSTIKLVFLAVIVLTGLGVIAVGMTARKGAQQIRRQSEAALQKEREVERGDVAVAFNDPTPPTAEESELFGGFLSQLGDSLNRKDAGAVGSAFDAERFTAELDRRGVIDRIPGNRTLNRDECLRSVVPMLGRSLAANESFQWDRVELRRVRWSADRSEAVVFALHRHPLVAESPIKVRWWFVNTPAGWKVYDLEELDFGIRFTELLGLILTKEFIAEFGANPKRFQTAILGLREAIAALTIRKNAVEAERHLDDARRVKLPPPLLAVVRILEARIFLEKLNPDEAMKRLDEADRLHPNIPVVGVIRAATLSLLGRPDEALPLVRKYLEEIGPDPDAYLVEGIALEGLENKVEAAAAFRKSLDMYPDTPEALDALRRVLPDDGKAELGNRLAKAADPGKLFEEVFTLASEAEDVRAIEELQRGLKKAAPGDVRGITPSIRRLIEQEKFAEAATEMRNGLSHVGDDKQHQVLNTYLYAMAGVDRYLEAYTAVPQNHAVEAFRILAYELDDSLNDGPHDEKPNEPARHLRDLIAAHRKRASNDMWIEFYEAVLLQNAKEYEKAEQAFATAQAVYLKSPKPTAPRDNERDWRGDQFRYRRVECFYALKQGLKAYAEVGPAQETFTQLAYRYQGDNDADGLDELIVAHRKRSPDDLQSLYWSAMSLQMREKLAKAADGFLEFARKANAEVPNYRFAVTQCVRNYLRADQLRDASAVVRDFGPDVVPESLRAAVALADGRSVEAEKILKELATETDGAGHLYYDEDFARVMARPENADLRKKYPDPRPAKRVGPKE